VFCKFVKMILHFRS